jgi:hypothetical protein
MMFFDNGLKFFGEFNGGSMTGIGKNIIESQDITYWGQLTDGKPNGYGA